MDKHIILNVFETIKRRTLKSINNAYKNNKSHDPWTDTGMGYDIGWISNELGRAQMFLLKARPELKNYAVDGLVEPQGLTTQDIFQQLKDANKNYMEYLIRVFRYFESLDVFWCAKDLNDNEKIEEVRNIL
jgi:hypothetical protein